MDGTAGVAGTAVAGYGHHSLFVSRASHSNLPHASWMPHAKPVGRWTFGWGWIGGRRWMSASAMSYGTTKAAQ